MPTTENPPYATAAEIFGTDADYTTARGAEVIVDDELAITTTENPPHDHGAKVVRDDSGKHSAPDDQVTEAAPQSPEQAGTLTAGDVTGLTQEEVG